MPSSQLIPIILFCILLTNCSVQRVTQTNYSKIKTGMTEAEVIRILGEPDKSSGADLDPGLGLGEILGIEAISGTHMYWRSGENIIIIEFLNGKVRFKSFTNQF